MARGKYLSLEEARRKKQLERFWKEHRSTADEDEFDALLRAMVEAQSNDLKNKDKL